MFKTLYNQARLTFQVLVDGPLLIKAGGEAASLDPTLPDMQFVRAFHGGRETVYLPGSSLKGVFRSRAEQILRTLGGYCCMVFGATESCLKFEKEASKYKEGWRRYQRACLACRLFGSPFLKGRALFADAYPVGPVRLGVRSNVGINRITGGAQKGSLFQPEVVEEGTFQVKIELVNYFTWQLVLLLYVLRDLHDGLLGLGMGGTRGYGRVQVCGLEIDLRDYRLEQPDGLRGYDALDCLPVTGLNWQKEYYYWRSRQKGQDIWCDQGWLAGAVLGDLLQRESNWLAEQEQQAGGMGA
ncbi:RAMP superfamily CRISPR-associated protein [Desulfurispora thermophila]|uniref:RAMP superfamily CRISPR-associated protein n=1 Tax=Desulfurispora thermophila TaxID=265470 RepID=UPI00035EB0C3|nr:RAMP superfamily CRISPR-associated protein [Desulfurispora thermophila]